LDRALAGVRQAFLVCTPDHDLARRETTFLDRAAAAGVEHVVKISAFLADADSPSPNLSAHAAVEEHLARSGMEFTVLRPNGFMQTVIGMNAIPIRSEGILPAPAADGAAAFVDLRDVSAAAHLALTGDTERNRIYELSGPEALTMDEIAGHLSRAFGKPVRYVPVPAEVAEAQLRAMGLPEAPILHVTYTFGVMRDGGLSEVSPGLGELGVKARTWAELADDITAGQAAGAAVSFGEPTGPAPG
ncbi:MAG: NmrA family NAD(P)-binding protein, partial [Holophagales bacterium]|nr:NmrA family NAD(P)-binding protein [Holophagales bacterium]